MQITRTTVFREVRFVALTVVATPVLGAGQVAQICSLLARSDQQRRRCL